MTEPTPEPVPFYKRNVVRIALVASLLLLIGIGQAMNVQAGQDIAAALAGSTRIGPVDLQYKGMRLSREHVLVARYEITGVAEVRAARWHAKPWGQVVLEP